MEFPKEYKILKRSTFTKNDFSIVPIRYEDLYNILKWRNEQIYHLRQNAPLTLENQENYFINTISKLFKDTKPNQLLFSYLKNNICIGYGGLVHINWEDKNAEISFIMDTHLEKDFFEFHWETYLEMIEKVAFNELKLHKIYVYAFDLRPHLYEVLQKCAYEKSAVLKEHVFFNEKFIDVVIHHKITSS